MNVHKTYVYLLRGSALSLGLMASSAVVNHAQAAQIIVTGACSLPEAIENTNTNVTVNADCEPEQGSKAYRVNGFDRIFIETSGLINLKDNMQTISGDLVIEGRHTTDPTVKITGARNTGGTQRLFWVEPGITVEFRSVSVINGYASGGNSPDDDGGCIYNDGGSITLIDSEVRGCKATDRGGAIYNDTDSELTIQRTVLKVNEAGDDGGAIFNQDAIVDFKMDSECFNNKALQSGGCIDSRGEDSFVHIRQTVCSFNKTTDSGGGCLRSTDGSTARFANPGSTRVEKNNTNGNSGGGIKTDDADAVEIKGDGAYINSNTPDDCEVAITATSGDICD